MRGERCPYFTTAELWGCKTDVEPVLYWSGPHIRADCSRCGRYIKFCPKVAPWTDLVPPPVIMPSLFEDAA